MDRVHSVRDADLCVIATEGEKTERQYFEMFGHRRLVVRILPTEADHKSAPYHVLSRLDRFKDAHDLWDSDTLWLVIDVDHRRPKELDGVCQEAQQKGFSLAISNPCFELWLLLHHAETSGADATCNEIEARLQQVTGSYNKLRIEPERFRNGIRSAIDRAKQLDVNPDSRWPAAPGTHVYKLIESLGIPAPP
jgi:hypothetical protein